MALIEAPIDASNPVYVGFRANNAAEMALLLTQWFVDNSTQRVMDIEIVATGAAPNFLCTLVAGAEGGAGVPFVTGGAAVATVLGGIGQVDAEAMATELGVAVRAVAGADTLFKSVAAGGGAGPHWMAIALTNGGNN